LLQLLFWYVLMQGLPAARQAWKPVDGVFLSNRGLILPSIPLDTANLWVLVLVLPGMLSLILHAQWSIELPELRGFNFVGGLTLAPEYFALLIALVTYTSAFIAEIVRSGIQAVPKGQWDAAKAL